MLKIKSLLVCAISIVLFLNVTESKAQKINQFDKNKKRTGVWKKYYRNGRVRYVGQFENGKELGVFKYYSMTTSRHPTIIKEFSAKSDSAFVKYYNLDGKLTSKGSMIGKKRVGKWIYYFSNGNLFSEENWEDGNLEGLVTNYFKNGNAVEETEYKNGKKNGFSKTYSDEGILIEHVNYKDGLLHGKGQYFELNGDLKEEGVYQNGKRYGKWEFYIGGKKVTKKERKDENKYKPNKN